MPRAHLETPFLLQAMVTVAACFTGFARQHSYGYPSSQKLTNQARSHGFGTGKGFRNGL